MKYFKKTMSLTLIAAMAMASLAGCGTKNESGADGDTFLIGGIGPLTGDAAVYGTSVKNGAEIAIKEINDAGGVKVGDKTLKLDLQFEDDQASEDKAPSAYDALMDKGMNVLMGTVTSGACLAILDKSSEDGILQITPSGSAQKITEGNDNVFRLCFTDPLQGIKLADLATGDLGKKKIAIIYNNSSDYSKGMKDAFVEEAKAKGAEIVAEEAFADKNVDFSTQLTKIKGTDADLIFIPAYYTDVAFITTQAKEMGMTIPFIGGDGWDGILDNTTDKAAVEGSIFLSPFLATDPNEAVQKFVKSYSELYDATPDQFAADGYDTIYVIKAAMEKAGSTKNEDLIASMTEIEVTGITGKMVFSEDGEPNKDAKFIEIKDGAYTAME